MAEVSFTSVEFHGFKAFRRFSISLEPMNVLVGANNSGKSTAISAFRALDIALRKARARKAEAMEGPGGRRWGWNITSSDLPITLENVHSDYEDEDSTITFRCNNGRRLFLHFPKDGGCFLLAERNGETIRTPSRFKSVFPVEIGVVPVLGPVEHEEQVVTFDTVRTGLPTHRASRHFRNYWRLNPELFPNFAELVAETWPGMTIEPPEVVDFMNQKLAMFCREDRMARELFWAGFGFQVWCQLLTHLIRSREASIVVIDEPEIYLHPDLQRKLVVLLRELGPDVLMATHSTEMMGEVDPSDLLVVDKSKRSAERLKSLEAVQGAIDQLGSVHNMTLTQLARTRRVLFVEGQDDFRRLRRFAAVIGLDDLASGLDLTAVEAGSFSRWKDVYASAWGIETILGTELAIGAVFDSDFWPPEEVAEIIKQLEERLSFVRVLQRKEMENYLLLPPPLERAIRRWIRDRARRTGLEEPTPRPIRVLLDEATAPLKDEAQSQYIARRLDYLERTNPDGGKDRATRTREALEWFSEQWEHLERRLCVVPGKEALGRLRSLVQAEYSISLTDARIISECKAEDLPEDLKSLLTALDEFRTAPTGG